MDTNCINLDSTVESPASKSIHTNQSTPNKETVFSSNNKCLVIGESIQQTEMSDKVSDINFQNKDIESQKNVNLLSLSKDKANSDGF